MRLRPAAEFDVGRCPFKGINGIKGN